MAGKLDMAGDSTWQEHLDCRDKPGNDGLD